MGRKLATDGCQILEGVRQEIRPCQVVGELGNAVESKMQFCRVAEIPIALRTQRGKVTDFKKGFLIVT